MCSMNLEENASRYYNGHATRGPGSVSTKVNKSWNGKMVPSKEDLILLNSPTLSVDNKLKFSDRLKALLKSGASLTDNGMEVDDPYTFSEPEPQVFRLYQNNATPNNTYSRKSLSGGQTTLLESDKTLSNHTVTVNGQVSEHNAARLYPALSASLGHSLPVSVLNNTAGEKKVADDDSSKTMNRLQAKIARNKVIGKHKKVGPSSRNANVSFHLAKSGGLKRERSLLEEQLLGIKSEFCVKKEPEELVLKSYKAQQQSFMPHTSLTSIPAKRRRSLMASRHNETPWHEVLQRISQTQESVLDFHQDLYSLGVDVSESEDSDGEGEVGIFQKHWFSSWPEQSEGHRRESRLGLVRTEMRRRLAQVSNGVRRSRDTTRDSHIQAIIEAARTHPSQVAVHLQSEMKRFHNTCNKRNRSKIAMLMKRTCSFRKDESDACTFPALSCTQYCMRHIMYNVDQLLFEYCTAKFSDNTQCCVPVFDICHELPLCIEHARKRDNYDKMCAEIKPKKVRKKAKPSAMTRPNKRGKKRRRVQKSNESSAAAALAGSVKTTPKTASLKSSHRNTKMLHQASVVKTSLPKTSPDAGHYKVAQHYKPDNQPEFSDMDVDNLVADGNFDMYIKEEIVESFNDPEIHVIMKEGEPPVVEGVEEVLAMAGLPLDPVELASQASRLLEDEHELTTVLNQLPHDFNLFFADKSGEYEPTKEETEELERALAAVDKDVESLTKLTETQGLSTLIDEHALAHTLAQLPEVPVLTTPIFSAYHNGFGNNSSIPAQSRKCTEPSILNSTHLTPNISHQTRTNMPS